MTEQEKKHSSLGPAKPGESFKDQVLRALHEGEKSVKPIDKSIRSISTQKEILEGEKKVTEDKETSSEEKASNKSTVKSQKSSKKAQKRRKEREQRKTETALQKEDRVVGKIIRRLVILLVLFFATVGIGGYLYVNSALQPLNKASKTFVNVYIPVGSSNKQIANILKKEKIIKDALVFNYFAKFHNYANFQSGYYNFKASDTLEQIANMLKKGGTEHPEMPILGKVVVKEGQNIDEIAKQIEINVDTKEGKKTPFKKEKFISLVNDEALFNKMRQKYPKLFNGASSDPSVRYRLEGYLCPATYNYGKDDTVQNMVEIMVATMNKTIHPYYEKIAKQKKKPREVLILASLVEREAVREEDRRNVAQVLLNRLQKDMPLETDISVLYALGKKKDIVTIADTHVDSPYNLYKNKGIGPGPFNSPSKMSIEAVLNPKANDYLYFVADVKTGKVYFSKTNEEHNVLAEKYVNNNQ
ncbi:MAG: endolytic transglycosylase MltG [Streptococcaceae bacterium]|nr:endolytic transglycosylase MltG [Streptococcaceae bacterium]